MFSLRLVSLVEAFLPWFFTSLHLAAPPCGPFSSTSYSASFPRPIQHALQPFEKLTPYQSPGKYAPFVLLLEKERKRNLCEMGKSTELKEMNRWEPFFLKLNRLIREISRKKEGMEKKKREGQWSGRKKNFPQKNNIPILIPWRTEWERELSWNLRLPRKVCKPSLNQSPATRLLCSQYKRSSPPNVIPSKISTGRFTETPFPKK